MSDIPSISSERVEEIFMDCLFREGEDSTHHIAAPGITTNVGFHPGRLAGHAREVAEMLDELPNDFKKDEGGGMSFLAACDDRHGRQWTGMHRHMEQLFQLGVATKKAAFLMPREFWGAMPGGMPYYVVE